MKTIFLILLFSSVIFSQINFENYFENKSLRIDYYHTGNNEHDSYSFDEMKEEPFWGGSKINLIDKFNYGKYKFEVVDDRSQQVIYSRTYSTLFGEWQTTDEAKQTEKSFSETVVFPYPKSNVTVVFYGRDKKNNLIKKFQYQIDPKNYFIKTEREAVYKSFEVIHSGDPSTNLDIVIIPDGYTSEEMDLFKKDCERFAGYLFNASPFKENKEKFNIWGIEAPSAESGTDIPAEDVWRKTLVNTSFYTFDLERYLMTSDNKTLRNVASNAPYDQIYILVNSSKYGGGSIYNHYSVCMNNNNYAEYVFVHEFGHGFGSLADEYFTSDVAYNDFYSLDVEPLDPNVTTLVDFESKWKDLVEDGTLIPTPSTTEFKNKVGAFEGGGYVEKGVYRPMQDCTMKSISVDNFCPVCKRSLQAMIDFYSK
ncbi:MAG TPA: M64 family metallopeptidase [Ignavibacteriaceae bacterium]|nr:M64 family metallopeptidase [Ignavibacteriaceae bacterium]